MISMNRDNSRNLSYSRAAARAASLMRFTLSASPASARAATTTSSGLSGSATRPHPRCVAIHAESASCGATTRIGRPAARISYSLLGTTTPSRPRFTVMTCASPAASTDGILLAGKSGRKRTFLAPPAEASICPFCAPSPTNTRPMPADSSFPAAAISVSHAPEKPRLPACSRTKRKLPRIAAAGKLESAGIGLVFVGDGAQKGQIEASAGGAKNVRFLPLFPASKIPSVLAAGDAHVITVKRGLEGVVVPSKLYEILAAGRPILVVAPQEADSPWIATQRGCGLVADPDRPDEVVVAARALAGDAERVKRMSEAARAAAREYDRFRELSRFIEIIEEARTA